MASGDKLVYFDARSRGEPTRMLYALAGKSLEEERVTAKQWPSVKGSKSLFFFWFWLQINFLAEFFYLPQVAKLNDKIFELVS